MNTGQKLVELSGLSGVSALAHLLAITQGGGTGLAKTVFASQMTIWREQAQMTLVQRPERGVEVVEIAARPIVTRETVRSAVETSTPAQTAILTDTPQRVARTKARELWIVSSRAAGAIVIDAPKSVVTRRRSKAVAVI